ncbi:hypothetical protein N665_0075s0007 [Sinapis alba]|nr:hypothetical protein N665_0075s0007 [Sinapis alba]
MDDVGLEFLLDSKKNKYDNFLSMVFEDYNMISEMKAVKIAYMFPKYILKQMPRNTFLIFLSNDRQLANFIKLSKTDVIYIYVSLSENHGYHDVNI